LLLVSFFSFCSTVAISSSLYRLFVFDLDLSQHWSNAGLVTTRPRRKGITKSGQKEFY